MLPSDPFVSNLYSELDCSTVEFQVLQLIVLMLVFGVVDNPLASCLLVHILEIKFWMKAGLQILHNENAFFHYFCSVYAYVFTNTLISLNMVLPCPLFAFFHMSYSALFSPGTTVLFCL